MIFGICACVALVAVWLHGFEVGIDEGREEAVKDPGVRALIVAQERAREWARRNG